LVSGFGIDFHELVFILTFLAQTVAKITLTALAPSFLYAEVIPNHHSQK